MAFDMGINYPLAIKRGSLVKHPKYGLTYVGGTSKNRISLCCIRTGKRLTEKVKPEDCKFRTYLKWKVDKS